MIPTSLTRGRTECGPGRRCLSIRSVATGTAALVAVALVALCAGVTPYRVLAVRSGSMEPAIATGDLVLTRSVPATELAPGRIVTFADSSRGGMLVTHRVVSVEDRGSRRHVVTRGDANTGVEEWDVAARGSVQLLTAHVPRVGYLTGTLSDPRARIALVVLAALCLAGARRDGAEGPPASVAPSDGTRPEDRPGRGPQPRKLP